MIVNSNPLNTLQVQWQGVRRMRDHMRRLVLSTFAFETTSPAFGNVFYNLPLVLAFEVLHQALLQANENGQFPGWERQLGELMKSAKTSLTWTN